VSSSQIVDVHLTTTLSYKPAIIKGKGPGGSQLKLWHVNTSKVCLDLCKSQLKVHISSNESNIQNEGPKFGFGFETKKTSSHWGEVFEVIDPSKGTAHVFCKHCKWVGKHPNSNAHRSTTALQKHFNQCLSFKRGKEIKVDLFDDFFKAHPHVAVTSDRLCESVLQVIVAGNLSFHQAENPALQMLLKEGFLSCNLPNRKSVAERLKREAQLARTSLRDRLDLIDSKVSLALDAWHSKVGNMEFLRTLSLTKWMISAETRKIPFDTDYLDSCFTYTYNHFANIL